MNIQTYRANRTGWQETPRECTRLEYLLQKYISRQEKKGIYYIVGDRWHTQQMGYGSVHNRVELINKDTLECIQLYNYIGRWEREQKSRKGIKRVDNSGLYSEKWRDMISSVDILFEYTRKLNRSKKGIKHYYVSENTWSEVDSSIVNNKESENRAVLIDLDTDKYIIVIYNPSYTDIPMGTWKREE